MSREEIPTGHHNTVASPVSREKIDRLKRAWIVGEGPTPLHTPQTACFHAFLIDPRQKWLYNRDMTENQEFLVYLIVVAVLSVAGGRLMLRYLNGD